MQTRSQALRQILRSKIQKRGITIIDESKRPVIVSVARTPVGTFHGSLSTIPGVQLGAIAVRAALSRTTLTPSDIQEVYLGNVVQAGAGQAPARQAVLGAGLPSSVCVTTINKMCASGMKSVMLGAQSILLGDQETIIAGGFESMSQAPFILPGKIGRNGNKYGHFQMEDALMKDGLTDAYNGQPMGWCAEQTAKKYGITREESDKYAIESYTRARNAMAKGLLNDEIVPVSVPQGKGKDPIVVKEDEEPKNFRPEKMPSLPTVFMKDGTVTAANASKLNDGASAMVITSLAKAKRAGLKPLARIIGYADAEVDPVDFPISPSLALPRAYKHAGITQNDVDFFEINEAFSAVALANTRILGLDANKLNVWGGAVAYGHAIGSSGSRILITLMSILKAHNAKIGAVAICNGGGGGSSVVIENMQ